jgi:hypothetical protein
MAVIKIKEHNSIVILHRHGQVKEKLGHRGAWPDSPDCIMTFAAHRHIRVAAFEIPRDFRRRAELF